MDWPKASDGCIKRLAAMERLVDDLAAEAPKAATEMKRLAACMAAKAEQVIN